MTAELILEDHVFLVGRPPISEYLSFMRVMALDGHAADHGDLMSEWRVANDHVHQLASAEAGAADNPPLEGLPDDLAGIAAEVRADPMVQRSFKSFPCDLAMVNLDTLVVHQKHINLAYVDRLKKRIGASPNPEQVGRLAFALDRGDPPVRIMQTASNSFAFVSPSNDFRFLDASLIKDPDGLKGYETTGVPSAVLALVVGYGSNFLSALSVEGRLVLNNGSHRAYALRDLGITRVPCLVQTLSRRDELELVGAQDLRKSPDRYLKDRRPPMLKDYFDEKLRKVVKVPVKNRTVKVSFGVEVNDMPAA